MLGDEWLDVDPMDGRPHRYRLDNASYMIDGRYLQPAVRVVDLGVAEESNG